MVKRFIKVIVCSVLLFGLSLGDLSAQDIHFSQFYASPLTLNPALTGKVPGGYRLAGIYRNQWNSVASPYKTPGASFDMPFFLGVRNTHAIGAGLSFVSDQTNDGALNTITTMLSVAYHKALGKNNAHQLSLGLQGGFVQKKIDRGKLTFGDQYTNAVLNPDIMTQEDFSSNSISYGDFNIGLFYSVRVVDRLNIFAGYSMFHLFKPDESFSEGRESELPSRQVVHGGLEAQLSDRVSLLPGVIYMSQAKAREINFGTNLGFKLSDKPRKEAAFYIGGWYRWEDAVIAMAAVELMERLRVGFSYDVNTSDLKTVSDNKGGFEISVIYIGQILRIKSIDLFCPRF